MKELDIFYITKDNKKDKLQLLIDSCLQEQGRFRNSLIKFIEQSKDNECLCLFNSHYSDPIKIKVVFKELNLDLSKDDSVNLVKSVVFKSIKMANEISNEPLDISKEDEILGKIKSKFNFYFSYKNDLLVPDIECSSSFLSIIDLVNEIFCEILISHLLNNGNKRLATMLLTNFLYFLGYYMKYTKSTFTNWNKYANKISDFIVNYHESKSFELLCKETKKFILDNIVLALNF